MNGNCCGNGCKGNRDFGPEPAVVPLDCLTRRNSCFRRALWTGSCFQVTLMSIPVGGEIGMERHETTDQLLWIAEGCALVKMGKYRECMQIEKRAGCGCAVIVPAGTWHNLCNTGRTPLKLYSLYAPPQHPAGTVQKTKKEAEWQERE